MPPRRKPVAAPVVEDDFDDGEPMLLESAPEDVGPDNAHAVPLFTDIDGRTSRSISQLRLLKHEPGGPPSYKGMIPLNSTLDTIGQVYGDGLYTIEGLNHKHTVLATKDNIRISLSTASQQLDRQLPIPGTSDSDRIERLALRAADESRGLTQDFTKLTVSTMEAAAERERNFYAASRDQMAQMFSSLLAMQQAGFQQTIAMMQSNHTHTIEAMNIARRGQGEDEGAPMQMVDVLLRGLQMGRELQAPQEDKPVWEQLLSGGMGILANASKPGGLALPAQNPQQPDKAAPVGKSLSKHAKAELKEALTLLREVRARGIDPRDLVAGLSEAEDDDPGDADEADETDEDLQSASNESATYSQ